MTEVCPDFGAELGEFNGETDHVHLLVHYPPKVSVSALVNALNGVSARRLRTGYQAHLSRYLQVGHLWSPSCLAASCAGAPFNVINAYIEQQKRPRQARRR